MIGHTLVAAALAAAGTTLALAAPALAAEPPAGIYQVWGSDGTVARPYVKGGQITLEWSQLEPARRRFAWGALDRALAQYHAMGKVATVQVNSTTGKPRWIWNVVARCRTVRGQAAPKYWDPAYLTVQSELVSALAAHLRGSPHRAAVALVRAAPNAIGTELTDFPGATGCGRWSKETRNRYYYAVMNLYRKAFLPDIDVALRAQVWTQWRGHSPTEWLGADGAWVMGTASDVDPNPVRDAFDAFAVKHVRKGSSNAYWEPHEPSGKRHLMSWNYWRILMELHKGVRAIAVYGRHLERARTNGQYRAAFEFGNTYAGEREPATAPGAWIALRKGTGRLAGNFSMFMTQVDPARTSEPLSSRNGADPIGPKSQRYGRYARRIRAGTRRNAMTFRLNRDFTGGIAGHETTLAVVYRDARKGQFRVRWGNGADQSRTVRMRGTGAWRELRVTVPGGVYRGQLRGDGDIRIAALRGAATFHMVRVRVKGRS
jgi:hypothetical protein